MAAVGWNEMKRKTEPENGYTLVLVPGDTQRTRSVRITPRALRVLAALTIAGGLFASVVLASWWYFAARTAGIPELERELARVQADNARITQLAQNLATVQAEYEKVRAMLGADILASEPPPDMLPADAEATAEAGAARTTGLSPEIPTSWPLATSGFVTQVLEQAQAGPHPGIDIAVPQHSYVRASGSGVVVEAGSDSIYGLYVLIEHGTTGYRSMYGHASRLYVQNGETVNKNQVIALSGNTGRSTAPHLHFEILQDGRPVDPFTLVQQPTSS